MAKAKHFLSLKWQFLIFCLLLFIPLILVTSSLFHDHTKKVLIEQEKAFLLTSIILISQQLSAQNMSGWSGKKKEEIISDDKTKDITTILNNIKNSFPEAESLVLVRRNGTGMEILASSGNPEDITSLNTPLEAGLNVPSVTGKNQERLITAYAPVSGSPGLIAVLQVGSSSLIDENKQFKALFEYILIASLLLILFLSFFAAKLFVRPLKKLGAKMDKISLGEVNEKMASSWMQGETVTLIESANRMNESFHLYMQKSEESIDQLNEKQKLTEVANQEIKNKNYQLNSTIITLNLINKLIEKLILVDDTQELMEHALPGTIDLIKARKGFIVEYIPEEKRYIVLTEFNTTVIEKGMSIPQKDMPVLNKMLETRNSLNLDESGSLYGEEYEVGLLFPLLVEKEVRGMMCILDRNDEESGNSFEDEDETTVRTLSKLVAAAWESIHFFELATTDTLTRLFVRGYFEKNLEEEIRKSIRLNNKLSIIMFDIDNLLKINETYGHETGDEVIKKVALEIKRGGLRKGMAALYSSEKFIVYLSDTSSEEAYDIAEEIRGLVSDIKPETITDEEFHVTISAGITTMPDDGKTSEKLIGNAEEALLRAKAEGKDRVVLFQNDK